MKLNRKGFMMAEVVVVSSVILIVLTTLYISYNKIFSIYETRLNYVDIILIYSRAYYMDYLIEHNDLNAIIAEYDNPHSGYLYLINSQLVSDFDAIKINKNDTLVLVKEGRIGDLASRITPQTFKDYVSYLSSSTTLSSHILVMERCDSSEKKNCKYAHLNLEI